MLAVLLALGAAAGYGSSDFAAGLAARQASVVRVTVLAEVTSVALLICVIPFISSRAPSLTSVLWGIAAGASGVTGAMALYLGFRHAAFSVASSVSAVATAAFSVLAGLALGEQPGTLSLAGIALALPAIVAVSTPARRQATNVVPPGRHGQGPVTKERGLEPAGGSRGVVPPGRHGTGRHAVGVGLGLAAGAGFGLFFIGLNEAGSGTDLWPIVVSQVAAMVTVLCVATVTRDLRLPPAGARRLSVLTGAIGATGTAMFFLSTHHGLLAVTAVITSLYPAETILLARLLSGERLTAVRIIGLCLAGASVGLIAAGGAG
ncbi:MAG TPA: EamA family transporter [Streptosporangiaceae bacterium]|nr:EamA family transporter [Streptosporangiaceae bacterium]